MKRKIIEIDEKKCTGCGNCIPDCPEGALQIIDGKARLISDLFCDGLGACVGACPEDAMKVVEREAEPYSEEKVLENIIKAGQNTIKAHLIHLKEHGEMEFLAQAMSLLEEKGIQVPDISEALQPLKCGCPGTHEKTLDRKEENKAVFSDKLSPELRQWPVQMHLINPDAGFLKNADLLLSADCTPYAYADFHRKFMKDKITITLCPKLDHSQDEYLTKLTHIIKNHNIKSITVVHMEVPCCSGIVSLVEQAVRASEKHVLIKDYTISTQGEIV